jgi:hypothetical protein
MRCARSRQGGAECSPWRMPLRSPCVAADACIRWQATLADSCLSQLASCASAQPRLVIALTFPMATCWADRALLAALPGVMPKARRQRLRLLVTPDTIVRWHRDIVRRRRAARSARGRTGRPVTRRNIQALARRLARENPGWGTAGFMVSSPDPGSRSQRPPAGRSSGPVASTPADSRPGRPGHNSCARRPRRSWRGFLHRRPARRHPGLCSGGNRARHPAHQDPRYHPSIPPANGPLSRPVTSSWTLTSKRAGRGS